MIDSRFKLQTMEPGFASVMISKNGVFLSTNLYKKLGKTKYIQVYLDESAKEIALVKCDENADEAVELRTSNDYAKFYNKDFISKVADLCGQSFDTIAIRVMGKYVSDGDYYIFDLKSAKESKKGKSKDE